MSQMQDWMRWQPTTEKHRLGFLVLTPARVVVGIGALVTMLAGLMPWAEGTVPGRAGFEPSLLRPRRRGRRRDAHPVRGWDRVPSSCTARPRPRACAGARDPVCPARPAAATSLLTGYRAATLAIVAWENRGGQGSIALGLYLAGSGIVIMGVGLAALLPGLIRWRRASDDPADVMAVSRRGVAESIVGLASILLGGQSRISSRYRA